MSWNRPSEALQPPPKKPAPSLKRGLLAGLVVVALGVIVLLLVLGEGAKPVEQTVERTRAIADKGKYKKVEEISRIKPRKEYATKPKNVEEALQRVEEAQEPMVLGSMSEGEYNGPHKAKMIFRSGTEQVLSWLCHVELGDPPIPPPPIPESDMERLAEILISKNDISEDDTPEAANAKQMVDAAKREMMKFIKDGGDPDDFMQYVFREQTKAFETRCLVSDMYEEMTEEDPQMAREFAKQANEKLVEQGIRPIAVPEESEESQENQERTQEGTQE